MNKVSRDSDPTVCSSFRSRYDEYRRVETRTDLWWQFRLLFCFLAFPITPLVMLFVHPFAGPAYFAMASAWILRELDGYTKHWDETSDD